MIKEDSIFISDETGKEVEMKIYLTFEANEINYVIVYPIDHEDELYPFVYDNEGNLYEVESDEELQMINEVVSAYEKEN